MIPIATKNRAGLMGPEQAKTLDKAVTTDGAQTITGLKTVSLATAVTGADYIRFSPTDIGVGKPYITIGKSTTATKWNIGLWDTASTTGTINISCTGFTHNDVEIARVDGPIFTLPPRLPSYTVATLPSAATYVRGMIYVSDGTSNKRLAISDGINWRFPDGTVVS